MDYFITKYDIECPKGAECAVLEDSIMQKGYPVTAGSKILENFISPLDATVVTRLEAAGVNILGKTKMDEFGAGGLLLNAELGIQNAELGLQNAELGIQNAELGLQNSECENKAFISGAVSAVADGAASFALCNDYTGAISRNAAAQGVCYIHPTYGTVSRYGLIPAVPSMDQIGIVCKTPAEGHHALTIIAGYDSKDGAMYTEPNNEDVDASSKPEMNIANIGMNTLEGKAQRPVSSAVTKHEEVLQPGDVSQKCFCVGIPSSVLSRRPNSELRISNSMLSAVTDFAKNFEVVDFDLKYSDIFTQIMQILCCAELSNNLTRYDGIKFGYRAEGYKSLRELYTKSRTEAFGDSAKMASIIGSMVLSQENYARYYDKAMRIRRLIKESLRFDRYDVILVPCVLNALPRLCGLPAITVPYHGEGITLIADVNSENVLFSLLRVVKI